MEILQSAETNEEDKTPDNEVLHHDFQPDVEEPGCGEDDNQITFRMPLNKQKGKIDVNTEAVKCMKTLADSIAKRDDFTVFGEHVGNQLRICGRNKYEITRAQHLISDICYKLVMGELARPPLPPNFPTNCILVLFHHSIL